MRPCVFPCGFFGFTVARGGHTIAQVHLSSTMGKGFRVDVGTMDPASSRFMLAQKPKAAEVPTLDDRDESEDGERQMVNASS